MCLFPHHRLRAVIRVKKGLFPWAASGRAIANGRDEGFTKLLFDDSPEAGSGDGHAGRGHGKILAAQQHDALRTYTLAMTGFVLPLTVITLVAVMMRRKPPAG